MRTLATLLAAILVIPLGAAAQSEYLDDDELPHFDTQIEAVQKLPCNYFRPVSEGMWLQVRPFFVDGPAGYGRHTHDRFAGSTSRPANILNQKCGKQKQ